jgi:hypothetical protein
MLATSPTASSAATISAGLRTAGARLHVAFDDQPDGVFPGADVADRVSAAVVTIIS